MIITNFQENSFLKLCLSSYGFLGKSLLSRIVMKRESENIPLKTVEEVGHACHKVGNNKT